MEHQGPSLAGRWSSGDQLSIASWSSRDQEASTAAGGGAPGTRWLARLVPWGPSPRKSWSPGNQPSLGISQGGYVGTKWHPKLISWGPMSTSILVTRGPEPASSWLERHGGGALVTRFRTGSGLEGPPAQEILVPWGPPTCGRLVAVWESGYVRTKWRPKLVPWRPPPRGSWSPGDQIRTCAGFPPREARGGWASGNHIPQMVGPSGISRAREPGLSGTTQGRTQPRVGQSIGPEAERAAASSARRQPRAL